MSYQSDHSLDHDKPGFESERILNDKNFIVVKHWVTVKIVHYCSLLINVYYYKIKILVLYTFV